MWHNEFDIFEQAIVHLHDKSYTRVHTQGEMEVEISQRDNQKCDSR